MDETSLISLEGAHALLYHLAVRFDASPAVKLTRATDELQACTRANHRVAAFLVKFRTAAARCASSGASLPELSLGGLLLRHAGLQRDQQIVQVAVAASSCNPSHTSFAKLEAALDRLHSQYEPLADVTITLTEAEHSALVAAGMDRVHAGPLTFWHCHKEDHVRFHGLERQPRDWGVRPPTSPMPRASPAVDDAPSPIMVVSTVAVRTEPFAADSGGSESSSAAVRTAAACEVVDTKCRPWSHIHRGRRRLAARLFVGAAKFSAGDRSRAAGDSAFPVRKPRDDNERHPLGHPRRPGRDWVSSGDALHLRQPPSAP